MAINNEEIYNQYIKPELKGIHMTDEYAANYFLQQGYLAARVEFLQAERKKESNGDWRSKGTTTARTA